MEPALDEETKGRGLSFLWAPVWAPSSVYNTTQSEVCWLFWWLGPDCSSRLEEVKLLPKKSSPQFPPLWFCFPPGARATNGVGVAAVGRLLHATLPPSGGLSGVVCGRKVSWWARPPNRGAPLSRGLRGRVRGGAPVGGAAPTKTRVGRRVRHRRVATRERRQRGGSAPTHQRCATRGAPPPGPVSGARPGRRR